MRMHGEHTKRVKPSLECVKALTKRRMSLVRCDKSSAKTIMRHRRQLCAEGGQAIVEFLIGTSLVLIILVAMSVLVPWLKGRRPAPGSVLQKTYAGAPYTGSSSEGVNIYAPEDILLH